MSKDNSLNLINEIWKLLKPNLELGDIDEAAELLVNYLVSEDYSPKDIKAAFPREPNIKSALDYFTPESEIEPDEEEDWFADEEESDY